MTIKPPSITDPEGAIYIRLDIVMSHTDFCPFGGGSNYRRESCQFGHPGCVCVDYFDRLRELKESK